MAQTRMRDHSDVVSWPMPASRSAEAISESGRRTGPTTTFVADPCADGGSALGATRFPAT
jgi:hypothetical protein